MVLPKENLKDCTSFEITSFIDNCVRATSEKTGKQIKVNTYRWSKKDLQDFIKFNKLEADLIQYLNGYFYDLPGYSHFE